MISGGGTGGHIYIAIAIAQILKEKLHKPKILFVGAKGKMEMSKVPEYNFPIEGLWISGIYRKSIKKNLLFLLKLLVSLYKCYRLIIKYKPSVVVGVGGYASGPLLYVAGKKGIKTLIHEQNVYAGLTNKWLAKSANIICVAHDGMKKYFPENKIIKTGNPVRNTIKLSNTQLPAAFEYFDIKTNQPTVLVIGGSLGAKTINESILLGIEKLIQNNIQIIWQCGERYYETIKKQNLSEKAKIKPFIKKMDYAYAVANIVIARAGALSIAELMTLGKPSILVPSPNVAEDHQTKNALALVNKNAAIMIKDHEAKKQLITETIALIKDKKKQKELSKNITSNIHETASKKIYEQIIKLIN